MIMATALEQKRALNLLRQRKSAPQQEDGGDLGTSASSKAFLIVAGLLILFIAFASDLLDYFIIGSIPILGDIIDVAVWFVIWAWVWLGGLSRPPFIMFSGLIELIPFGDFIPTFTLLVLFLIFYNLAGKKIVEKVSI